MHALGNYIIQNRMRAIGIISFLSVVSLLVPVVAYPLCGVPLALLIMRRGASNGLQVIAGCLLLTALLVILLNIQIYVVLVFILFVWGPVFCCASVLRGTDSQGWMVFTAGIIGMIMVLALHIYMDDVAEWWQVVLDLWIDVSLASDQKEQFREVTAGILPLMNALLASVIVVSLVLTTLMARWWQSVLFNPGGFRDEFAGLKLPEMLLYPCLAGIGMLLIAGEDKLPVLRDLLIITVFLYLFQGISAIHRTVRKRKLSTAWLVGMYSLLVFLPQMVLFVAFLGMADSWSGNRNTNQ
jgi:hypothetical protein